MRTFAPSNVYLDVNEFHSGDVNVSVNFRYSKLEGSPLPIFRGIFLNNWEFVLEFTEKLP